MKKTAMVVCCSLIIVLGFSFQVSAQSKTLSIATLHLPPISDENAPGYGFIGELFQAVFEPYGYTVNIKLYPWSRARVVKMFTFCHVSQKYIFPISISDEKQKWERCEFRAFSGPNSLDITCDSTVVHGERQPFFHETPSYRACFRFCSEKCCEQKRDRRQAVKKSTFTLRVQSV